MQKIDRLELLALKADSFDTDLFLKEAFSYTKNSIVYVYDTFAQIYLAHKPDHIKGIPSAIKYSIIGPRQRSYRFFAPFVGLLTILGWMIFAGYLCVRYRPKVCWTENTWAAVIFGIARKIGLCEYSIYCVGDWVSSPKRNFFSYVLNNIIWRCTDYIAATCSDLVLSLTSEVIQARDRFWGKKVARRACSSFPPPLAVDEYVDKKIVSNIYFLGQVRKDSGLELFLPLLPALNQRYGIKLKIAGPQESHRVEIERQIKILGVEQCVELHGWVETKNVGAMMKDCFCGINLLTNKDSYSSYTIPGKLIHYLQNMLPVLITEGNGPFTEIVRQNKLGLVIEPEQDQILGAILSLFERQMDFRKNIKQYVDTYSSDREVKDYIEIASGKENAAHRNPTGIKIEKT